jgi:Leucine-rich repeat (LRR) protein
MKTSLGIFFAILLLTNCVSKTPPIPTSDANKTESNTAKPLIIGGKQYHSLYPIKAFTLDDIDYIENLVLDIDPLNQSSMDNLDGIEQLLEAKKIKTIWISVKNLTGVDLSPLEQFKDITELDIDLNGSRCVLPNLTLFKSLNGLGIYNMVFDDFYSLKLPPSLEGFALNGKNLYKVDLSAIETLHELTGLRVEGDIDKLPDLTKLEKLRSITIKYGALESLEGIGAPNIRRINIINWKGEIDSLAPLNNLLYLEDLEISNIVSKSYRIADISNLPSLKKLWLNMSGARIDLQGIENLSALEYLSVSESNPFNIESIGKLKNLEQLDLNLISPQPSLEFIRDMPNLWQLGFSADENREGFPRETEAYQVLDVSPLASLEKLRLLYCTNFIIKNISALDANDLFSIDDPDNPSGIYLWRSRLYDDTEKSRHFLAIVELLSG